MEQKERRALDKCFDSFLKDLDPSPSFLHSLYAENILTEEQVDYLSKTSSRETKVAMMLRFLPHRGPNAFTVFQEKLVKDYPWLAQKLLDELGKLKSGQASINRRLLDTIITCLIPLIYADNAKFEMCDVKAHPGVIIQKLDDLLRSLESKCHKALDMEIPPDTKTPLHKLIDERLKLERKNAIDTNLDDLNREVKDLKKQLKDVVKLKGDNAKLKSMVERQKDKVKDYNKMSRDCKKYKQEMEKYRKECETLRREVEALHEQMRSNISNLYP